MTLIEITVVLCILSIIMCSMLVSTHQEAKRFGEMASMTDNERTGREMTGRIESMLDFAIGASPQAFLVANLAANDAGGSALVDTTLGFPPQGVLLLEPGTAWEERLEYNGLDVAGQRFLGLGPAAQCTAAAAHVNGQPVHWAGMAVAIDNQDAPPADQWEGRAESDTGPVFFRGDGTAFSFRLPTDPTGENEFFDADGNITWGATVGDTATLEGWAAIRFDARDEVREADVEQDLNADGDRVDIFDLGRIEVVTWNAFAGGMVPSEIGLCPPIVMQERCNWGGDLDGDGFEDPLFLWIPSEGRLELRAFLAIGAINRQQVVRHVDSTIHLKNGAMQ